MLLSGAFACFIIVVVILKYVVPQRAHCPQCYAVRRDNAPLCNECSWIFEVPDEDDEIDVGDDAPEYSDDKYP